MQISKQQRRKTSQQIAQEFFDSTSTKISASTVRRRLFSSGYFWRAATKKPRLSKAQKQKRLQFAKDHSTWNADVWRKVLWSDEMNIEVEMRKNRVMLRRTTKEAMNPRCLQLRTKQGSGSVGVWCCLSYYGVGFFLIFDGRMNSQRYYDVLGNFMLPTRDLFFDPSDFIFQQDNAPCHTAKIIKTFFEENRNS